MVGGVVLVALGVLGMFLLGPTPQQSLLGEFFWLDDVENYAQLSKPVGAQEDAVKIR